MKASDLRQKTTEELIVESRNLREKIFAKKFQSEIEQVSNPAFISRMRRDVARIRTILREKGWKGDG
jgi:large subunit ribosomal protein L29